MQKSQRSNEEPEDPFFNLKYIAWCRTQLPPKEVGLDQDDLVQWAKWAICRKRNVLFNDPIWDNYTPEEIIVEYYSIIFDINEQARNEFESIMQGVKKSDLKWLEEMEKKYQTAQSEEAKALSNGKDDIEDTF